MKTLNLDSNKINSIPVNAFKGLGELKFLNLSGNQISTLPANSFGESSSLTRLSLSYNKINTIQKDFFKSTPLLEGLSLNSNQISDIPVDSLSELKNLSYLELSRNNIKVLPKKIFSGLTQLKEVWLEQNPIEVEKSKLILSMKGLWVGQIGQQNITACFFGDRGGYYYQKHLALIPVNKGTVLASDSLVFGWKERDGIFNIENVTNNTARGFWLGLKNTKSFPLQLKKITTYEGNEIRDSEACSGDAFHKAIENPLKISYSKPLSLNSTTLYREASIQIVGSEKWDSIDAEGAMLSSSTIEILGDKNKYQNINNVLKGYLNEKELFSSQRLFMASNGLYKSRIYKLSLNRNILSFVFKVSGDLDNGVFIQNESYNLDLNTGLDFDITSIFDYHKQEPVQGLPKTLANIVLSRFKNESTYNDCYGEDGFLNNYSIKLENDGIKISIPTNHKGSCEVAISMTYKELTPYLNKKGKNFVGI